MDNVALESNVFFAPSFPKFDCDEDEDCEFYFLQPASSPYNMSDKIEAANQALYAEDIAGNVRQYKVKFKEELTDFEPDLTDDDVQSIESYNEVQVIDEIDEISRIDELNPELKYIVNNNNKESMLSIDEEADAEEITEEIDEVVSDSDITPISPQIDIAGQKAIPVPIHELLRPETAISNSDETPKLKKRPDCLRKVDCKKHCIDSLDSNLELCIRKLQINEKLPHCPTLKLQKRYCCSENTSRNEQKLPNYSGLKSEYGLSKEQWIIKSKTNELVRKNTRKRKEISKEFQKRKVEHNEQIFSEWLSNLKYKKQTVEADVLKKYYIPQSYLIQPNNHCDTNNNTKPKEQNLTRPKTTGSLLNSKANKQKRPNTSHHHGSARVYIEIPPDVLSREVQLGNLIVRSIKKNGNDKLTITAVKNL